jgi:hypothetical protein
MFMLDLHYFIIPLLATGRLNMFRLLSVVLDEVILEQVNHALSIAALAFNKERLPIKLRF